MTKVWQMGRWTETDNPCVCLAYKLPVQSSMFSIFSFLEALEQLYTLWAMVGSLDQRYMGFCSTVELNLTPVLTGL